MKITTKMGDKGETGLFGGRRVSKTSRIIDVIGGLDELQAVIGWCGVGALQAHAEITDKTVVTAGPDAKITNKSVVMSRRLQISGLRAEAGTNKSVVTSRRLQIGGLRAEAKILTRIEDDLYRIMSIVGFEFKCPENIKAVTEADVKRLEKETKKYEILIEKVGGLKKFVRPGKSELSARLHIARTVCRRVERGLVGMIREEANWGSVSLDVVATNSIPGNGILKYLNRLSDLLFVMAESV